MCNPQINSQNDYGTERLIKVSSSLRIERNNPLQSDPALKSSQLIIFFYSLIEIKIKINFKPSVSKTYYLFYFLLLCKEIDLPANLIEESQGIS